MKKFQILLADDHKVVRDGLKLLIARQPDMGVVGEAGSGKETVEKARQLKPDLILLDLSMPGMNGLQVIKALGAAGSEARILVLTTHEDQSYFRQVCQAGAAGYVIKRMAGDELVICIRKVAAGERHFDEALSCQVLSGQSWPSATNADESKTLSPREAEVLIGVAWGYSNKELAGKHGLSVKTIETYKVRLCEKLGLNGRAEIVRYAVRQGWLTEENRFGQPASLDLLPNHPPLSPPGRLGPATLTSRARALQNH